MSWIESLLDVKDVSMRCAARAKWMLTIQRPSDSPKRGPTAISPTCTGSAPVCPPGQAHPGQSDRLLSAGSGRPALLPGPHHGGVVVGHPLFELRRRRHVPVRDPRRPVSSCIRIAAVTPLMTWLRPPAHMVCVARWARPASAGTTLAPNRCGRRSSMSTTTGMHSDLSRN